jgi:hypothetical protein
VDPATLRDEIQNGPLKDELAPLVTAGRDSDVTAVLNRKDRTGYVPARHVSVSLARFPSLDAVIHWVLRTGTLPDGTALTGANFGVYVLFRNLDREDRSNQTQDPLRATVADLQAGLAQAQAAGLVADAEHPTRPVPADFGSFLIGGEVKISRADELNSSVTDSDVGKALLPLR